MKWKPCSVRKGEISPRCAHTHTNCRAAGEKQTYLGPASKGNWSIRENPTPGSWAGDFLPISYFCSSIYHWCSAGMKRLAPRWSHRRTLARPLCKGCWRSRQITGEVANIDFRFVCVSLIWIPTQTQLFIKWKTIPLWVPAPEPIFDFNIMCTGTCKINRPVCAGIQALADSESDTLFCSPLPFQSKIMENFGEENRIWTKKNRSVFQGWERHEAIAFACARDDGRFNQSNLSSAATSVWRVLVAIIFPLWGMQQQEVSKSKAKIMF